MKHFDDNFVARFWGKVDKRGKNECWPWKAGRFWDGYGKVSLRRKHVRAHRASYAMHVGPIPPGMYVLHSCDNPACVNPRHLRTGTHTDNMAEMRKRGRSRVGERNINAKLTNSDVKDIRALRAAAVRLAVLARRFGVSEATISRVANGKTYRQRGRQ